VINIQDPPVVETSHSQTFENVEQAAGTETQEQEGLVSSIATKGNGGYNSAGTSQSELEDREIIDPIVAKEQWDTLFSKRAPPRCEHGEPCTKLQTKIKGLNSGRHFWICARYVPSKGATPPTNYQFPHFQDANAVFCQIDRLDHRVLKSATRNGAAAPSSGQATGTVVVEGMGHGSE